MIRTDLAMQPAPMAGAARACGDFGHGYQWRLRSATNAKSTNASATKRTARRLGKLTT